MAAKWQVAEAWSSATVEAEGVNEVVRQWITLLVERAGSKVKCIAGERYGFIFYSLGYLEQGEWFKYRIDLVDFRGFSNSTGDSILNEFEPFYLGDIDVQ